MTGLAYVLLLACAALLATAQPSGLFYQVSDIHLDPYYNAGSSPAYACHRGSGDAGKYGGRPWCDLPQTLLDATFQFVSDLTKTSPPDFVVWTGDNARHDSDPRIPRPLSEIVSEATNVGRVWKTLFGNTTVVPSIGNNDVYPHNTMYPVPNDVISNLSIAWQQFFAPPDFMSFSKGGYYEKIVSTKLSILSLNTIYFYQPNHAAPDCNIAGPAANQISWINAVLTAAAAAGRKVYLTGHIPPDPGFYKPGCMAAYSALSSKFAATIGGHLYAHTHQDNFIFATDPNGKPVGVVNICPSLVGSYNPSVRVFRYDPATGTILDYTQYFADMDVANKQGTLTFTKEYSFLEAYGLPDFSLNSWLQLNDQVQKHQPMHKLYKKYRYVSSSFEQRDIAHVEMHFDGKEEFKGVDV